MSGPYDPPISYDWIDLDPLPVSSSDTLHRLGTLFSFKDDELGLSPSSPYDAFSAALQRSVGEGLTRTTYIRNDSNKVARVVVVGGTLLSFFSPNQTGGD